MLKMDLHKLSGCEMLAMIGRAVSVEVLKDRPITGNVYLIDPESRSIVLVQYDDTDKNHEKPSHIVIVPGDSVCAVRDIVDSNKVNDSDGATPSNSELDVTKAKDQIAHLFDKGDANSPADDPKALERCGKIINFLEVNKVSFSQNGVQDGHKLLQIGAVKIGYPYNTQAVVSNNTNAMKKMIMHLKSILES